MCQAALAPAIPITVGHPQTENVVRYLLGIKPARVRSLERAAVQMDSVVIRATTAKDQIVTQELAHHMTDVNAKKCGRIPPLGFLRGEVKEPF